MKRSIKAIRQVPVGSWLVLAASLYLLYDVWATHPGASNYGIWGWNPMDSAFGNSSTFTGVCRWITRITRLGFDVAQVVTAVIGMISIFDYRFVKKLNLCSAILLIVFLSYLVSDFLTDLDFHSIKEALSVKLNLRAYRELISISLVFISSFFQRRNKWVQKQYLDKMTVAQWLMLVLCGVQIFYALCSYPGYWWYYSRIENYELHSNHELFSLYADYFRLFLPEIIRLARVSASVSGVFVAIRKAKPKEMIWCGGIVLGLTIAEVFLQMIYGLYSIRMEILLILLVPAKMFEFLAETGATLGCMICAVLMEPEWVGKIKRSINIRSDKHNEAE